jgi:hypothetical protein
LRRRDWNQPLVNRQNDERKGYCEKKATFHELTNGIQAGTAKRVTAQDPFQTHPAASDGAMGEDGFNRIFRAGWQIPA